MRCANIHEHDQHQSKGDVDNVNYNIKVNGSKHELIPVGRAVDLTGRRFERLTALGRTHNKSGRATWLCECECGNYTTVITKHLVGKAIMSCGCLLKELQTPIDLNGKSFGRWKVLEISNKRTSGDTYWKCQCECGTVREVLSSNLRSGISTSCGCYRDRIRNDITGKRFGKLVAVRRTGKSVGSNVVWEMSCDCGGTTYVHTGNLGEHHRKTRSCGCLHLEVVGVDLTGNRYGRLKVIKRSKQKLSRSSWLCECSCGEVTIVQGTHLNSGATRSCGCLQIELSSGKNNHNYNPNKTDEERLKKRYILGKHTIDGFRNKVYKRDDYTCQVCQQVGGKLNAHHLDGWNWAVDKRFDTDNGVTLCESCHNEFHNIYGKGNNTREQFEEYHNKHTKITLV